MLAAPAGWFPVRFLSMTMTTIEKIRFRAGEVIFSEGDQGDCAYIVECGHVAIRARTSSGEEVQIGLVSSGELFGEMALIDQSARKATAMAQDHTELMVIPREHFEARLDSTDLLIRLFLKVLMDRYREMREHFHYALDGNYEAAPAARRIPGYIEETGKAKKRLEDESALRGALERGEFVLFYQPIVSIASGQIVGGESLIRWRDPARGIVPPSEFIGLAEESGIIVPLGAWIMEAACRNSVKLNEAPGASVFVSINVSGKQFEASDPVEDMRTVLRKSRADPGSIKLEITESLLMQDPDRAFEILQGLKSLGVQIALDDFGTGYSSFSYLHRFPIDSIKIDRSFVSKMTTDIKSREIVRTLCELATSIGMSIIAEGIESMDELQMLLGFGAGFGQGYFYSKPLPDSDFARMIHDGPGVRLGN